MKHRKGAIEKDMRRRKGHDRKGRVGRVVGKKQAKEGVLFILFIQSGFSLPLFPLICIVSAQKGKNVPIYKN